MIVTLLFGGLFLLIALGLPIALAIGLPAIGLILAPGVFPPEIDTAGLGQTIVQLLFAGVDSFDLLAVPLFMLAGSIWGAAHLAQSDRLIRFVVGGHPAASVRGDRRVMFFAGISWFGGGRHAALCAVAIPRWCARLSRLRRRSSLGRRVGGDHPAVVPDDHLWFLNNVSIASCSPRGMMVGMLFGLSFMAVVVWKALRHGFGSAGRSRCVRALVAAPGDLVARRAASCWAALRGHRQPSPKRRRSPVVYAMLVAIFVNRHLTWSQLPGLKVESQVFARARSSSSSRWRKCSPGWSRCTEGHCSCRVDLVDGRCRRGACCVVNVRAFSRLRARDHGGRDPARCRCSRRSRC